MQYKTRVPTTRPDLADVLRGCVLGRVAIEASKPSEWVAHHQESLGLEVVVLDPNFAPMHYTRQQKTKTDPTPWAQQLCNDRASLRPSLLC